jgi:peptidylprolyl isomerase
MRALAKQGLFDGLSFQFVYKGYVAETAAPPGVAEAIPAELSNQPFTRGIVGMSHPKGTPDGATGKFFIALGRAQVLDGKYTAWGKVVSGMEHLDTLVTGGVIKSLKLAN